MVFTVIFGVLILVVVVYIALKVLHNAVYGALLIALIFVASFLILGSFPNLRDVPIIGNWLPDLSGFPSTTGGVINVIRGVFYNLDIIGTNRASSGNLLVIVANTGRLDLSGFEVFIDDQPANIVNEPKSPLKSGESTAIEVDWKAAFNSIIVSTKEAATRYP